MFRNFSKLNILLLLLVAIVLGGILRFAFSSNAATAPTIALSSFSGIPGNGGVVMADAADNKKSISFRSTATDAAYPKGLRTRVFYKRSGDAHWTRYGTSAVAVNGPDGAAATPNGITTAYSDAAGMNCEMGWGSNPPASCSNYVSPSGNSGASAFSGYPTYTKDARLTPGTYYWMANAKSTSGLYSGWSAQWSFTITANPSYNPGNPGPPPPDPVIPSDPAPSGGGGYTDSGPTGGDYVISSGSGPASSTGSESAGSVTDTQPPSTPGNLTANFDSGSNAVSLIWDESTDNNGVAGYEIQRSEKGKNSWTSINKVGSAQYTDFNFAANKSYEYQVRAYDAAQNNSPWSASAVVQTGDFKPNATADGGSITDSSGTITVEVPQGAVPYDISILINKVQVKGMVLPQNTRLVGSYYDVRAKDSNGNEVKNFKKQLVLKFNLKKVNLFGVNQSTLAIMNSRDNKNSEFMATSLNSNTASTLTDHFSVYFLSAAKTGFWGILAWTIFWILVIGGVIGGGYYGWRRYQLSKYQEEHSEDFIYKH